MAAQFGFGCYRVSDDSEVHAEALREAIAQGVRVIDTSSNYTNGASERLVGITLAGMDVPDDLNVVTKIGYAQGDTFGMTKDREMAGEPYEDIVEVGEGMRHCIHPDFLADVLDRSLERLLRESVDTLLLHNPEYFLQIEHQHGTEVEDARQKFFARLKKAFTWLEEQRSQGRIGSYGISSNTFGNAVDAPDHVSLETCIEVARSVAGDDHGFTHAQMPLNIIEHFVATANNQSDGTMTTLAVAKEAGLHVMTNRPLNAIVGTDIIRLASHDVPLHPVTPDSVEARIHELEIEEHEVQQIVMNIDGLVERDQTIIQESYRIASALCQAWNTFEGLIHWRDVRRSYLTPRLDAARKYAERSGSPDRAMEYLESIVRLLDDLDMLYAVEENQSLEELREAVADDLGLPLDTPLQHLALHAAVCTDGVTTVLVGMRRPEYVRDAFESLSLPETTYHRSTWNRIAAHIARISA